MTLGLPPAYPSESFTSALRLERIMRPWQFVNGLEASAFRLTASPTSGYLLKSDAYGNGSWSNSLAGTIISVADNEFSLYYHGHPTRIIQFDASDGLDGLTRTFKFPSTQGIVMVREQSGQYMSAGTCGASEWYVGTDPNSPVRPYVYIAAGIDFNYSATPLNLQWVDGSGNILALTAPTLSSSPTVTLPDATTTLGGLAVSSQVWTAANTFRAASALRSEAAATQDAVVLAGRAGGTSSYAVSLTPAALTGSHVLTLPDATMTAAGTDVAQTFTALQTFNAGALGATVPTITVSNAATGIGESFLAVYDQTGGNTCLWAFDGALAGATLAFPASGGVVLTTAGNTLIGFGLRANTSSSGASFFDTTTTTKRLRMVLSSAVGNNSLSFRNTAARDYEFRDQSGHVCVDSGILTHEDNVIVNEGDVVVL